MSEKVTWVDGERSPPMTLPCWSTPRCAPALVLRPTFGCVANWRREHLKQRGAQRTLLDHLVSPRQQSGRNGKSTRTASCASSTTATSSSIPIRLSVRSAALRKNTLFAGHDLGADNWAIIGSLIETCKLSAVNPLARMTDTMTKLVYL